MFRCLVVTVCSGSAVTVAGVSSPPPRDENPQAEFMGTMGGGNQRSISVSRARSTLGTFKYVLISDGRKESGVFTTIHSCMAGAVVAFITAPRFF